MAVFVSELKLRRPSAPSVRSEGGLCDRGKSNGDWRESKAQCNSRETVRGKEQFMAHSTVTRKGQTTIPGKIRKALQIKPGDRLEYVVEGDHARIRVHPGTRSLKGALASKKGKKMSFGEIREAATRAARGRAGMR